MKYLKDYLKECNKYLLLEILANKHIELSFKPEEEHDIDLVKEGYEKVIDKCLSFGEWKLYRKKYKVWFSMQDEMFSDDDEKYIDVCLRNLNYIKPDDGLKPWGGSCEDKDDAPDGHYNINHNDYNERFAIHLPWRLLVSLEVDFDESVEGMELEKLMAEFIWEITFDGFEENSYQKLRNQLDQISDDIKSGKEKFVDWEDAKKQIKDYIEDRTPDEPIEAGNFKIRISESALDTLKDIASKESLNE
jgi:hypothetical protein